LISDKNKRPSCIDILNHPFIKKYKCLETESCLNTSNQEQQ